MVWCLNSAKEIPNLCICVESRVYLSPSDILRGFLQLNHLHHQSLNSHYNGTFGLSSRPVILLPRVRRGEHLSDHHSSFSFHSILGSLSDASHRPEMVWLVFAVMMKAFEEADDDDDMMLIAILAESMKILICRCRMSNVITFLSLSANQ